MVEVKLWGDTKQASDFGHYTRSKLEKESDVDFRYLSAYSRELLGVLETQEFRVSDRLRESGEFELMLTIFRRSLVDALTFGKSLDILDSLPDDVRENLLHAGAWLISGESEWLHSLICVCSILGFNPTRIRNLALDEMQKTPEDIVAILRKYGWTVYENQIGKK